MVNAIKYLIGVDGGGTNVRACIAASPLYNANFEGNFDNAYIQKRLYAGVSTRDMQIIGKGHAGPANIATDLASAARNIMSAVHEAAASASLSRDVFKQSAAYLGLAGAHIGTYAQQLSAMLPFALHFIGDDVHSALIGALGNKDGAIAILGTGSVFMSRKGSSARMIGGWGFQLSDLGGGARMGRDALEQALLAYDGITPSTPLTQALLEKFENKAENMVLFVQTAGPKDYGAFVPIIVDHLKNNDATAKSLFKAGANAINLAFDALMLDESAPIALLGGLAEFYPEFIAPHYKSRLITPKADAQVGALMFAQELAENRFSPFIVRRGNHDTLS